MRCDEQARVGEVAYAALVFPVAQQELSEFPLISSTLRDGVFVDSIKSNQRIFRFFRLLFQIADFCISELTRGVSS